MIVGRGYITITNIQGSANLIDWRTTWKEGELPSGWDINGLPEENAVVLGDNPFGAKSLLWKCVPDIGGNSAGGFVTPSYILDNEHTYRYTTFVYRKEADSGHIYLGCYNVDNLSGGANINPYFFASGLPSGQWYLLIGHIHPSKADATWKISTTGIYTMSGNKIIGGTDFKLRTPVIPVRFRDYLYSTPNPDDIAYFYNPRLEVCDGNEPSIEQLLRLSTRSEIDGVKTVYDSEFSILKAQVSSKVESATFNELGARVGAAETTIQQQASAIALKAEKSEVTALGTRMSNAEQKITSDAINMVVKSQTETIAQGKIDGLQIGGKNLLIGSDKLTAIYLANGIRSTVENGLLKVIADPGNGNYVKINLFDDTVNESDLNEGDEVVISYWAYSPDSTLIPRIFIKDGMGYFSLIGQMSNNLSKFYYKTTWKKDSPPRLHLGFSNSPGTYYFKYLKLEKGNKATDWSPAPEDVAADAAAKADAARIAAEAVAVAKANLAKTESQAYADGIVTAEEQRAINDAQAKLNEAKADAALKYTTKTEYDAQIQILNNEISQRVTKSIFDAAISDAQLLAKAMSRGLMLYNDPTFKKGYNNIGTYNNAVNGSVVKSRELIEGIPNDSGYGVKIVTSDGNASPGLGGFYFGTQTKANRTMVCRFVARIPEGQIISFATNPYGTGGTASKWLTPYVGTGKWEEYAYYVKSGETGTFSGTFYFCLNKVTNQTYPITWDIAYATVFDLNASEVYTPLSVSESNKIQLENLIASKVSQTTFDALGNRVGAAESEIAQIPSKISLGVTESKSYADDKVNGLQFGGINFLKNEYLRGLNTELIPYGVKLNISNVDTYFSIKLANKMQVGKEMIISFNCSGLCDNVNWAFGIGGGSDYIVTLHNGRVSYVFTVESYMIRGDELFPFDDKVRVLNGQTTPVQLTHFKLEEGNKATSWSLSPEDVAADAAAKADAARIAAEAVAASKAELAKTTAQAYADGIVTAEEQRAINDAQAKLDEAKADAQTKATAAENAAKEAAAVDATNKVGGLKEDMIRTGIDIENRLVTVTSDTFLIKNNAGAKQAVFTNGMLRTALIKAEEIVTRTVICRDSEGNIVSAINKEGDGAFRLYYPDTGKVQMEFKATATNGLIASYRPDGYLNWKIGANAGFITNSIDSWEIIKLFATSLEGLGIQTMENLPGTNFYTFMASYGSPLAAYKGLTMKYGYPTSTAPTGVTAEMKIPDGWYTHPGPPYVMMESFDENLPTRYARWLMRYAGGFEVETRELELDIDPNGGVGWLE